LKKMMLHVSGMLTPSKSPFLWQNRPN
jgi:hypothetical protein